MKVLLCMLWVHLTQRLQVPLLAAQARALQALPHTLCLQNIHSQCLQLNHRSQHAVHQGDAQQPGHCTISEHQPLDHFNTHLPLRTPTHPRQTARPRQTLTMTATNRRQ
jgi:hypothetical protein